METSFYNNNPAQTMLNKERFILSNESIQINRKENNCFTIPIGVDNLTINFFNSNNFLEQSKNLLLEGNGANSFTSVMEILKKNNSTQKISDSILGNKVDYDNNTNLQINKKFPINIKENNFIWYIQCVNLENNYEREKLAVKIGNFVKEYSGISLVLPKNTFNQLLLNNVAECLWNFHYKTNSKDQMFQINVFVENCSELVKLFEENKSILESIFICKFLGSAPSNLLYPESYSEYVQSLFKDDKNIAIDILGEEKMKKLGMNAILSVGQASPKETKMVLMECGTGDQTIMLAGKGVTFDTGGINLKLGHFPDMKYDMLGSAVVVSIMYNFSKQTELMKKFKIVGVIGLAENQIGGNASCPNHVIKNIDGKTIEILNTDAEGRVLLSDTIGYGKKHIHNTTKKNPDKIFVFATLTGSIKEALGPVYAGMFSNSKELCEKLSNMGEETGDLVWPMPCNEYYDSSINNSFADIGNITPGYKGAGSIKGAKFLETFIGKDIPYAYFDIGGVAYGVDRLNCSNYPSGHYIKLMSEALKQLN